MSSESHMSEPSILSHPFPPQKYPLPPTYANFSAIFCHRYRYLLSLSLSPLLIFINHKTFFDKKVVITEKCTTFAVQKNN